MLILPPNELSSFLSGQGDLEPDEDPMENFEDPEYDESQSAFYYARVVQNPTCRWTTYDSLRLGLAPPDDVPATVKEMAWSSPIWIKPQ